MRSPQDRREASPGGDLIPTTLPEPSATSRPVAPRREPHPKVWLRPLVILTTVVALGDVVFMALIPSAIPPLVVGVVLTLVGIVLLRGRPRAGIAVLGVTSLVLGSSPCCCSART